VMVVGSLYWGRLRRRRTTSGTAPWRLAETLSMTTGTAATPNVHPHVHGRPAAVVKPYCAGPERESSKITVDEVESSPH
jgi:hypothetical protein